MWSDWDATGTVCQIACMLLCAAAFKLGSVHSRPYGVVSGQQPAFSLICFACICSSRGISPGLVGFVFAWDLSWAPLMWVVAAEVLPAKVRLRCPA